MIAESSKIYVGRRGLKAKGFNFKVGKLREWLGTAYFFVIILRRMEFILIIFTEVNCMEHVFELL